MTPKLCTREYLLFIGKVRVSKKFLNRTYLIFVPYNSLSIHLQLWLEYSTHGSTAGLRDQIFCSRDWKQRIIELRPAGANMFFQALVLLSL